MESCVAKQSERSSLKDMAYLTSLVGARGKTQQRTEFKVYNLREYGEALINLHSLHISANNTSSEFHDNDCLLPYARHNISVRGLLVNCDFCECKLRTDIANVANIDIDLNGFVLCNED